MRRVVEPLLSGGDERPFSAHDLEYVRDLGLIARDDPPRIANPVYAEVVPRELTYTTEAGLVQTAAYMVRCGAAEGHLVVFDRDADRSWEEKVFRRAPDRDVRVHVWGM